MDGTLIHKLKFAISWINDIAKGLDRWCRYERDLVLVKQTQKCIRFKYFPVKNH